MKRIRLYDIIDNENTVNNIISLYKSLRAKEYLELRLYLKTMIWAGVNREERHGEKQKWVLPEVYFSSNKVKTLLTPFTMQKLKMSYNTHKVMDEHNFYGFETKKIYGNLI